MQARVVYIRAPLRSDIGCDCLFFVKAYCTGSSIERSDQGGGIMAERPNFQPKREFINTIDKLTIEVHIYRYEQNRYLGSDVRSGHFLHCSYAYSKRALERGGFSR